MTRLQDWQVRYAQFTASRAHTPFCWGTNDCVTFAADAVYALTGVDLAPPHLRLHRTTREATEAIKLHGGMGGIATGALGQSVSPLMAGVGDVVLIQAGRREHLAICNGLTALAPAKQGLANVSMELAVRAWKV